ncbi:hypothetical protein EDB89DRAFT_1180342 [Lactarius sanguifluus]|nr:hypothetical protein EDB89DRAFT_1180342 [Lactarius sanguifluus]
MTVFLVKKHFCAKKIALWFVICTHTLMNIRTAPTSGKMFVFPLHGKKHQGDFCVQNRGLLPPILSSVSDSSQTLCVTFIARHAQYGL